MIVDSGIANLASITGALRALGDEPEVSRDRERIATAERLIVPGVGAFAAGRAALAAGGLDRAISERAAAGVPLLGICLGFQLLTEGSEEAPGCDGLGLLPGTCRRLPREVRVPQLGWNLVEPSPNARLVTERGFASYANSFALAWDPRVEERGFRVASTIHGARFVAAMEAASILGCQFHPELSGPWGLRLLRRFLEEGRDALRSARAAAAVDPGADLASPGLSRRIVPCLDVAAGRVVKGVQFTGLRDVGDPAELARRYQDEGADEIVFLDITASIEARGAALATVRRTRQALQIPFTVGGGVRSADDAERLLTAGADKVSVNTAAVGDPSLLSRLAERFGRQAVVLAIDARRHVAAASSAADSWAGASENSPADPARWEVLVRGGREVARPDAVAWAAEGEAAGAGEILLTSWDRDGTNAGPDLDLLRAVRAHVRVPLVASGGLGDRDAFAAAFASGADAALAASLFHDRRDSIGALKRALRDRGVTLREVAA
jgi:imidazole glycerol phosphate synthase glutamine amidotransferase subunit